MSETKTIALMPLTEVRQMAEVAVKSGMFGPDLKTTESAMALMLLCHAEGIHPYHALRRYHIIKGRPSMKADAMLAEFQARGGKVEWIDHTDTVCTGNFSAPGIKGVVTMSWTIEDAKRAQVYNNPGDMWKKYPRQMLRARVISEAVRMCMPEVVVGIYTPEEVADFEPARPEYTPPAKVAAATAEVDRKIAALKAVPKEEQAESAVNVVKSVFPGAKEADRTVRISTLACGPAPTGLDWTRPHAKNWLKKVFGVDSTGALTEEQQADAEMLLQTRLNSEDAYNVALTTLIAEGHVRAEAGE